MLLAVLMKWAGILQMQLFQINQSEESNKISINSHTNSGPLHEQPITLAAHYRWNTLMVVFVFHTIVWLRSACTKLQNTYIYVSLSEG